MVGKKLINSVDTCVDECLRGLSVSHPHLVLHPEQRVLFDGVHNGKRKVAVVSGGGSGHEPFAGGYVGPGMLTAAIAGSVFASPPSSHILHAIRTVASLCDGGVFVIIPNYTGDILNFGLAIELAKGQGIQVESVVVGEDIALESHGVSSRAGRRGMCGLIAMMKITGYLASIGADLHEIKDTSEQLLRNMASMGCCLEACSLPGSGPLFRLDNSEMELGVGVHGEAGVRRMKLSSAHELAGILLELLTASLGLKGGGNVVVLVNNLGAMSHLEQWLLAGEVHKQLKERKLNVDRIYAAPLFTSLNMAGAQVCLINLPSEIKDMILKALDHPTGAPGWPGLPYTVSERQTTQLVSPPPRIELTQVEIGPILGEWEAMLVEGVLKDVAGAIIENETKLNELDSGCGDGDCGTTLRHLAQEIQRSSSARRLSFQRPTVLAAQLADIAQRHMGGTSGAIYSLFLTAASGELEKASDLSEPDPWAKAWRAGLKGIMKYSRARVGDRTMLDALEPGCTTFETVIDRGGNGAEAFNMAVQSAQHGCQATKTMRALAGRASYVGESHLKEIDAGAFGVVVWLSAVLKAFQ